MGIGILSPKEVLALNPSGIAAHRITRSFDGPIDKMVKESALDLPLGDKYWVMKGSCRTGSKMRVSPDLIRLFSVPGSGPQDVADPTILQRGKVYLFKVDCDLNLSDTKIQGRATARSSIGRLDVLVRLLCDETSEFDRVREGYSGGLFVEVTPITFDLVVRPGTCLSQLRLFRGSDRLVSITREEFQYEEEFPVVGERFDAPDSHEVSYPFRLDLSPDPGSDGFSGFMAKEGCTEPIDPSKKDFYDPHEFWDGVPAQNEAIELEPDRLYILRSKQRLSMPGHIALECQAYTETMGEWRIEYAGFAHPYFGSRHQGNKGSPLMFEVRGHNIPTILTHEIPLGNVCFKRMSEPVDLPKEKGAYEDQELKLSSCFKNWK